MSKVLASIGTGPQEALLRIARRTFVPYAHRHGFALCTLTEAPSHGRPPAWAKIVLLRQLVQEHELVVWIDADAMIVDGSVDIATTLPDDRLIALRRAFDRTLTDEQFLADAKKLDIELDPMTGEDMEVIIKRINSFDPAVVQHALALIKEK